MSDQRPPRDDLYRGLRPGMEVRDVTVEGESAGPTLVGHFARFDAWNRIDSVTEGTFLERIKPGAFSQTFATKGDGIKVLFQHGRDPQVGDKPIAMATVLREDAEGPYFEAPMLEGVPPLITSGIRSGVYGVSYRFRVLKEDFIQTPRISASNPDGIPERTIKEAEVYEFGPVTFPADAGADVAMRSLTDIYVLDRFAREPARLAELIEEIRAETPALPVEAAAEPHPEPESRDTAPPPDTVQAALPKENTPVEYSTREDKASRVTELKAELARLAVEYPGVLPTEAQARWDDMCTEEDSLIRDIAAWDERQVRLQANGTDPRKVDAPAPFSFVRSRTEADIYDPETWTRAGYQDRNSILRDNAMRALETTKVWPNANTDVPKTQDKIAHLIDEVDSPDKQFAQRMLLTNSPLYKRAFGKILAAGGRDTLSPEEMRGTALAVGVDGTGGYAVPLAFDPTIIAIGSHTGMINPYRSNCRVVPIVGTDTWNPVTATAITATRTTEAAAATEQGPTFAKASNSDYIVKRVQAQVTYSKEMAQDRPDLPSEIARLIQEAKDNEEENQFCLGVGTTVYPLGVMPVYGTSNMYTSMDTAGSTTLAAADAYAVEAALPVRWRFGARWIMNRGNIRKFQALETTSGILFQASNYFPSAGSVNLSTVGNTGLSMLGYPVDESPSAPTAATSHINIAVLFNPQTYIIVDRIGMSISIIPDIINSSALALGQSAVYAIWRNTAAPLIADGGRVLDYKT